MPGWRARFCAAFVLIGLVVMQAAPGQALTDPPGFTSIPSAVPGATPQVSDGQVNAIAKVGDVVVLGGTFTAATAPNGGTAVPRTGILAFDAATGQISSSFAPNLNGDVLDLEPGPTPGTVYAVGRFTQVNGATYSKAVLLDVSSGSPVAGFKPKGINGAVNSAVLLGGRLFLGGYFTKVNGTEHGGLATLDAQTGNVDPYLSTQLDGHHNNSGSGAVGAVGVQEFDIAPAGDRLVAIGNFRTADGQDRDQVVMLKLGESGATVAEDWQTNRYKPLCYSWAFDSYVRGVDFAPDGSYFVVASTGGYGSGTLCDSAARFETYSTGSGQQPTWVNYTGGDTLWAVEATETAVFVGGHQRWLNNSFSADRAGAGAVPRPGLAALSTKTGLPLKWNPGRHPRGVAVFDLLATGNGLYVGSDTDFIGNREYRRGRIAYFPLAGGAKEAKDTTATLPGTVLVGGTSTLSAMSFDGTNAGSLTPIDPMGFNWRSAKGAFLAGGNLFYAGTDGKLYRRSFNGTALGTPEALTPWNDPVWAGVPTGSGSSTYTGSPSGFFSQISSLTSLTYANGRIYYTLSNRTGLYSRWFNVDSGIVGADEVTVSTSNNWRYVSSTFIAGDTFYYVSSLNGSLYALPLSSALGGGTAANGNLVVNKDLRGTAFLSQDGALANDAPIASFSQSCVELTCTFDASDSSDPDGTVAGYAWDFGDGTTSDAAVVEHTFTEAGTFPVSLTVTDDRGATGATSQDVQVVDQTNAPISFVAGSAQAMHSSTPNVSVPTEVQEGDTLLLTATVAVDVTIPDPEGWTRLDSRATTGMTTYVWTRTATAADAGSTAAVTLPQLAKSALSVSAYRGANAAVPVGAYATAVDSSTSQHVSPQLQAPTGSMVVTMWSDKGPSTTDWTAPAGVSVRAEAVGSGTGRVSVMIVDGGGAQAGPVGGLTAVTDATSNRGVSWTIALVP